MQLWENAWKNLGLRGLEPWALWCRSPFTSLKSFMGIPWTNLMTSSQMACYNQLQKCWDTPTKNDLSCFKSLLVTGLWDIILTSLLPPIQSCSSKFWVWSCIASNFDKGWRGDHKHKIMDRPFMPKYGTVSQVVLQLVVATRVPPPDFAFWAKSLRGLLSADARKL